MPQSAPPPPPPPPPGAGPGAMLSFRFCSAGPGAGDEGVGHGNDFVAWTDAQSVKSQDKGVGARVHAHGVRHAGHLGEAFFELVDFRSQYEPSVVDDPGDKFEVRMTPPADSNSPCAGLIRRFSLLVP